MVKKAPKRKTPGGHKNPKGKTHGTTAAHRRLLARVAKLEKVVDGCMTRVRLIESSLQHAPSEPDGPESEVE